MPKQLKIALVATVVLVLFMSARGTATLWSAEGTANAGIVTTGSLHLHAGDGPKSEQAYSFTELNGGLLLPGQFVQAPLTITNGGTLDLDYDLAGATTLPAEPTAADAALTAASILSIYADMDVVACTARNGLAGTPLYTGPAAAEASFGPLRQLAAGHGADSEVLCVRVEIPASAPQTASGGRLHLVLNFRGQQQ